MRPTVAKVVEEHGHTYVVVWFTDKTPHEHFMSLRVVKDGSFVSIHDDRNWAQMGIPLTAWKKINDIVRRG